MIEVDSLVRSRLIREIVAEARHPLEHAPDTKPAIKEAARRLPRIVTVPESMVTSVQSGTER